MVTSTDQVGNYRVQAGGTDGRRPRLQRQPRAAEQTDLDRVERRRPGTSVFGALPFASPATATRSNATIRWPKAASAASCFRC